MRRKAPLARSRSAPVTPATRRLHVGHSDHSREQHEAGERVEAVVKVSRAVLDPAHDKGSHKVADIADGVDQRHCGRGRSAGQESRR